MRSELYHYGVKGMKWGVRRYRNKDGTLTAAGKKRYDRDVRENKAKKKDNRIQIDGPDPSRWVREDLKRAQSTVDASSKLVKDVQDIERRTSPKSSKKPMNLSNMSDADLRNAINRANLEKQYTEMFGTEQNQISRGREYARNILETAGTVLAVGSSALGIAVAIKELRG